MQLIEMRCSNENWRYLFMVVNKAMHIKNELKDYNVWYEKYMLIKLLLYITLVMRYFASTE